MNSVNRILLEQLKAELQVKRVLVLVGARRVGKTVLIKELIKNSDDRILQINGDDVNDASLLSEISVANYSRLLKGIDLFIIDEAQYIPNVGRVLKLIVDHIHHVKILVTGSSMFDLTNKLGEPLVGRKKTIRLFPLSQLEFSEQENVKQTKENLELRLIYGAYPNLESIETLEDKKSYLSELVNDYLLKDILIYQNIRNANKIFDLLKLIAYQVGSEVSLEELGRQLQLSKNTVESYLDLLEKVFIIYQVRGFSRNLRKEVTKKGKWYFYDNGIRNAIIQDFSLLNNRNDIGLLWENYIFSERIKSLSYQKRLVRNYFWRTYDQQEIDLIEEEDGQLNAFELKLNRPRKTKAPGAFKKAYPDAIYSIIHQENYLDFIS